MENADIIPSGQRTDRTREPYCDTPMISDILNSVHLSPLKIRELLIKYQKAGVFIEEKNVPYGYTLLEKNGTIRSVIPVVEPYGNDGVAVHELFHIEQFVNAFRNGLSPEEIGNVPPHDIDTAEIGALEGQLEYLNKIPRFTDGFHPLRNSPAYKESRRQVKELLNTRRNNLPGGYKPTKADKLNPYKRVIDLNSSN